MAVALAGSSDLLYLLAHPTCGAGWFMDSGMARARAVPVLNDLPHYESLGAAEHLLRVAGVGIADFDGMMEAVRQCEDRPALHHALLEAALVGAKANGDVADFGAGRPVRARFEGCARQWRGQAGNGVERADAHGKATAGWRP